MIGSIMPQTLATALQASMKQEDSAIDRIRHSRSFNDVKAVDAGHALAPPPLKKIRKSLITDTFAQGLKAVQEDENDVCAPWAGDRYLSLLLLALLVAKLQQQMLDVPRCAQMHRIQNSMYTKVLINLQVAEVVIVCEPEGATLTMGALHPRCG